MHAVDMFILISIGQVVGWLAAIYIDGDFRPLLGYIAITTAGAFTGGYLSLNFISEFSKFSMIFSAFFVAGLLLYTVRFRKWSYEWDADAKRHSKRVRDPSDISFGKQIKSVIVTLIIVIFIFLILGWAKSLQIQNQWTSPHGIEAPKR